MTAQTKPLTIERIVAENAETLSYLLDQDVTALAPAGLVEALQDAGREFSESFEQTNQNNGAAMSAAAAFLADTLPLDTDDPDMQVLLRHAQTKLRDTEI